MSASQPGSPDQKSILLSLPIRAFGKVAYLLPVFRVI
jgi:hypothetical protein